MRVSELRIGATYERGPEGGGMRRRVITGVSGDLWTYPGAAVVRYNDNRGNSRNILATTFARWAQREVKAATVAVSKDGGA